MKSHASAKAVMFLLLQNYWQLCNGGILQHLITNGNFDHYEEAYMDDETYLQAVVLTRIDEKHRDIAAQFITYATEYEIQDLCNLMMRAITKTNQNFNCKTKSSLLDILWGADVNSVYGYKLQLPLQNGQKNILYVARNTLQLSNVKHLPPGGTARAFLIFKRHARQTFTQRIHKLVDLIVYKQGTNGPGIEFSSDVKTIYNFWEHMPAAPLPLSITRQHGMKAKKKEIPTVYSNYDDGEGAIDSTQRKSKNTDRRVTPANDANQDHHAEDRKYKWSSEQNYDHRNGATSWPQPPLIAVSPPTSSVSCPTSSNRCQISSISRPTSSLGRSTSSPGRLTPSVRPPTSSANCHKSSFNRPASPIGSLAPSPHLMAQSKFPASTAHGPTLRSSQSDDVTVSHPSSFESYPASYPPDTGDHHVEDRQYKWSDEQNYDRRRDHHVRPSIRSQPPLHSLPAFPFGRPTSSVDCFPLSVDRPTSSIDYSTRTADRPTSSIDYSTRTADRPTSSVDRSTRTADRPTSPVDRSTLTVDRPTSSVDHSTSLVDRPKSSDRQTSPTRFAKIHRKGKTPTSDQVVSNYQGEAWNYERPGELNYKENDGKSDMFSKRGRKGNSSPEGHINFSKMSKNVQFHDDGRHLRSADSNLTSNLEFSRSYYGVLHSAKNNMLQARRYSDSQNLTIVQFSFLSFFIILFALFCVYMLRILNIKKRTHK